MHHGLVLDFLLYRGNDTRSKLLEALPKIKSVIFSRDRVSLAPSVQSSCLCLTSTRIIGMSHQTQLILLDSKYKYKMRLICNVSINIFPFTVKHSFFFLYGVMYCISG